jgi:L-asparagine transporter-like permease
MRLNPPKKITFWISVIVAALGAIGALLHYFIPSLNQFLWLAPLAFILIFVAYLLLFLGLLIKGF